jgi:alkanesulfonate monooxygenase SsuD/methylene tetrahydromethanopterin reductase-like flavin-dependent oxidoreductase (luciferase family)
VLYRVTVHVADTDQQAYEDLYAAGAAERRPAFSTSNRAVDEGAASAGYYGRDAATQRARLETHALDQRVALGQILLGSPETVLDRVRWIRDEVGAGIVELIFQPLPQGKTRRAIELFGTQVLPHLREL